MDSRSTIAYFKKVEGILKMLTILNLTAHRWPKPVCVQDGSKFDFIVVGGGTAGCLIASKLAEYDADVLLVEAGHFPPIESEMSGLFPFMKKSKYDWNFTSTCEGLNTEYHTDNVIHMSQGKVLGGSSSLSFLAYAKGYPHDYNEWATITNDTSWSWKSVSPLFRNNEKLIDEKILKSNETHCYGTKGKIKIKKQYYKVNRNYFDALQEIGYENHLDINEKCPLGFTDFMFNIGDDIRQSTATKFLSPLKKNKKLHLILNTLATKIIFDCNKTAVGVEVLTEDNRKLTLKATKEVIVTAGTIKSPQLLMLSGIGPKEHLQNKGIKVISNLPVGKNFQDHVNALLFYKMKKAPLSSNPRDPYKYPFVVFDGYVALNKCQSYPDYETVGVHIGDSLTFLGLCAFYFSYDEKLCNTLAKDFDNKEVFMVYITYLNPESRGEILLQSSNPNDDPLIFPGYYTKSIDIQKHASYLADFNRIVNTTYFKRMKAEFVDPKIKSCEGLERGTTEYWKCHTLGTSDTAHYFVGTCAMGTVLDSKLRVHGVKRLRVADASVMPKNIHGVIQAAVMMIARKASNMIIKEHGLKKPAKCACSCV